MIKRITIKNYKSIEDVTVELGPLTVLVGRSGAGKSNFVGAIRLLRDFLHNRHNIFGDHGHAKLLLPAWDIQKCPIFELAFSVDGINDLFTYKLEFEYVNGQKPELRNDNGLREPRSERLSLGDKVIFEISNQKWVVPPKLVNVPHPNPPMVSELAAISDAVVATSSMSTGIGCYDFPYSVMVDRSTQKRSEPKLPGLWDDGDNYMSVIQTITQNLRDISIRNHIFTALKQISPLLESVDLDSLRNPSDVIVASRYDNMTIGLKLSQQSVGFRRFYAHLLALYQQPPKQTVIFEEPENAIYPGALAALADQFKLAADTGRSQVILTTHSPVLLDQFDVDCLRVVDLDGFKTRIGPVSPEQKEAIKEQLLRTGELLTIDPARLDPQGVPGQ